MAATYTETDRASWEYLYFGDRAAPTSIEEQPAGAQEPEPALGSEVESGADRLRRRLLHYIADAPGTVGIAEVATLAGVTYSAARQHLAVLKGAGLVTEELEKRAGHGRRRLLYRIAPRCPVRNVRAAHRLPHEAKPEVSGLGRDDAGFARPSTPEREAFLDAWGDAMRDGTYREDRNTPSRARYASDFQAAVCKGVLSEFYGTVAAIEQGGSLTELKRIFADVATAWRMLIEDVSQRPVGKDVITKWLNVADRNRSGTGARRTAYPYGLKCYLARIADRDPTTRGVSLAAAAEILRVPLPSVRRWVREVGESDRPLVSASAPAPGVSPAGEVSSAPVAVTGAEEAVDPEASAPSQPWGDEVEVFGGVQQAFAVPSEWLDIREPEDAAESCVAFVAAESGTDGQGTEPVAPVGLTVPPSPAMESDSQTVQAPGGCAHETLLSYMADTLDAALSTIGALQEQLQRFVALGPHCPECTTEQPPDGQRLSVGIPDTVGRQVHVAVLNGRYDEAVKLAGTVDTAQLSTEGQRSLAWDLAVCSPHRERS